MKSRLISKGAVVADRSGLSVTVPFLSIDDEWYAPPTWIHRTLVSNKAARSEQLTCSYNHGEPTRVRVSRGRPPAWLPITQSSSVLPSGHATARPGSKEPRARNNRHIQPHVTLTIEFLTSQSGQRFTYLSRRRIVFGEGQVDRPAYRRRPARQESAGGREEEPVGPDCSARQLDNAPWIYAPFTAAPVLDIDGV